MEFLSSYPIPTPSPQRLAVMPFGGCGEQGANLTVLFVGESTFFVDAGLMPIDLDGSDVTGKIPDIESLFLHQIHPSAFIFTHAHEDHIGALPWFYQKMRRPIYGTKYTLAMIERRLKEHSIIDADLRLLSAEGNLIDNVLVTAIPVNHSIPGAVSLLFDSDAGSLFHSGDLRFFSSTEMEDFVATIDRTLGDKTLDLALIESTNSLYDADIITEQTVQKNIESILYSCKGNVIVSLFSSNTHRIQNLLESSYRSNRLAVCIGDALHKGLVQAAQQKFALRPFHSCFPQSGLINRKTSILVSGCQGEARSTALRFALQGSGGVFPQPEDTFIHSARPIPGNETRVARLLEAYAERGCTVVTNQNIPVHASGHASQGMLKAFIKRLRPRTFIPIHGTTHQLIANRAMAIEAPFELNTQVVKNGQCYCFSGLSPVQLFEMPMKYRYLASNTLTAGDALFLDDRRRIARAGFVSVVYLIEPSGQLKVKPVIHAKGTVAPPSLFHELALAAYMAATLLSDEVNPGFIKSHIRRALERKKCGRPLLDVQIVQLERDE